MLEAEAERLNVDCKIMRSDNATYAALYNDNGFTAAAFKDGEESNAELVSLRMRNALRVLEAA